MAPQQGALGLRRTDSGNTIQLDTLPRDSAALPAPPGQSTPIQQPLTRSLEGDRVRFLGPVQQMVLQVALLQSLEQEVPGAACQARARATGHRPQPVTGIYMRPREPALQGETVQAEAASSPLKSGSLPPGLPLPPHLPPPPAQARGQSSLTLQDEASSRALCSPWLMHGLSGGDLG